MFKKWDILLYIMIITVSGSILYGGVSRKEKKADCVEIYMDGKLKYKYKLSDEKKIVEVETENGKEEIVIENRSVKKIKSSCKNKLCEKQGVVSHSEESIICVPNKEIIKISGESELDYIIK